MEKKQLILIGSAVVAGIMAIIATSMYITDTTKKQAEQLRENLEASQKESMAALQKSQQEMGALAEELNRVKTEQAQTVQKQMADMQAALQVQIQKNAQQEAPAPGPVKLGKPSLALKTPAGKRAVTVMIDSLSAVGGLLNPGDFVDVLAQLSVPANDKGTWKNTVSAMIFQGLQVLAVNTNLEETGLYYDQQQNIPALKVTFAVDPQEAGLLSFANKNGKLELALRSPQETERQMVKTSTWKALADYVLQNQGADIELPDSLKGIKKEEIINKSKEPEIQIFRGGKEL